MDWLSEWQPGSFMEMEHVDPAMDAGRLTAWLVLIVAAVALAVLWYRQRVFRRSFWCATAGRDVEVHLRFGKVLCCSAFEHPSAIGCDRRCVDQAFRARWPRATVAIALVK